MKIAKPRAKQRTNLILELPIFTTSSKTGLTLPVAQILLKTKPVAAEDES
jgi:hypothetical protein